jgi:uncharacterized protein YqgC (DUF456 family)
VTVEQIIGLALALLIMAIGTITTILPALPGTPVLVLAALAHRLYFGDKGAAWWVIGGLVLMMIFAVSLDYLATVCGAKKLGATWRGATGAIVGGLVGLFFGLPGILLGPFAGALLFELLGGRGWKASSKAGVGATLGLLAGALGKLACCIAMMGLFAVNVIYRSLQ